MRFVKWLKSIFDDDSELQPKIYTLSLPNNKFAMCIVYNKAEAVKIFTKRGFKFDIKDIEREQEDGRER